MNLFYRKYGEGHPLVILHGLYGSSDNWVTVGKKLADYFEVFIIDQRNHGHSPHSDKHDYQSLKTDLFDFLNQHSLEKAILLGHSMGGKVIMNFANDFPERISRLIVVDISPRKYSPHNEYSYRSINHKHIMESLLSIDFSKVSSRDDIDFQLSKKITNHQLRQFLLKNIRRNKDNTFEWNVNVPVLYSNFDKILDGFTNETINTISGITGFPVLIVKGANSDYITDIDIPFISKLFPSFEIVTIPDSGHWLHVEQPDLLTKKIIEFVFK